MADAVETAGLPETQASLPSPVEPEQSAHDAGTAFDRLDAAVLRHIVRWLPLRDVAAAAQACRALRDVVSEQETWHDKALQILGVRGPNEKGGCALTVSCAGGRARCAGAVGLPSACPLAGR